MKRKTKSRILAAILTFVMVVTSCQLTPVNAAGSDDGFSNWTNLVFGASTATEGSVHTCDIVDETSVHMGSTNNAGKISGKEDGLNYYYLTMNESDNVIIKATAKLNSFTSGNNQVSFGLMLRDQLGEDGIKAYSNSVSVGYLDQKMEAWYKTDATDSTAVKSTAAFANAGTVAAGSTYDLEIQKIGDTYTVVCDGEVVQTTIASQFTDDMYVGIYVARACDVTFSNVSVETVSSIPTNPQITSQPTKTTYFQGDTTNALDLTGFTATVEDAGNTVAISADDCYVTGFDTTEGGESSIVLDYRGCQISIPVSITALAVDSLDIIYTPVQTEYHVNDALNLAGMEVQATYNSGVVETITQSEEVINADGTTTTTQGYTVSGFDSTVVGRQTITLTYNYAGIDYTTSFEVEVLADELSGLVIAQQPTKTVYYIGEEFSSKGIQIKAVYGSNQILIGSDEYVIDASTFSSEAAGTTYVTITYKGASTQLELEVRERAQTSIKVTELPKTTYTVGESFNSEGIEVSRIYDSGVVEVIDASGYTIDASEYNSQDAGSYTITVTAEDFQTSFIATVREAKEYTFNTTVFGSSTSAEGNTVTVNADGSITIMADNRTDKTDRTGSSNAGKITGSQDGITYYYTELDPTADNFVMTATFEIDTFGSPSAFYSQEAFGIMVRDANGPDGDSSIFASNIAYTGTLGGNFLLYRRQGITNSTAAGDVVDEDKPTIKAISKAQAIDGATYTFVLEKDNSGFYGAIYDSDNNLVGEKMLYADADAMATQDTEKMYLGFFAARYATVTVTSYDLQVTAAQSDAEQEFEAATPATPQVTVTSLATASKEDYTLKINPSVDGTITVKQGTTVLARDVEVTGKVEYSIDTDLIVGKNAFQVVFTPDPSLDLTSYENVSKNFTVTRKQFNLATEAIYASPTGTSTGDGTQENPLDVNTAITYCQEGQTIYLLGGTYNFTSGLSIARGNNGTASAYKTLSAYNGEEVIFDFAVNGTRSGNVFWLAGNYWHVYGIEVANCGGFRIGGSNNIVELCTMHDCTNTGLQISALNGSSDSRDLWPTNNTILNCESYDNRDATNNDADGFAAKLTCGEGNSFIGCISHNNADDGWDLYSKLETGAIGAVTLEGCIAYNNGTFTWGEVSNGDKNGFKLGGEGLSVTHTAINCISFGNGANGFDNNSDPSVRIYDCVSYNNFRNLMIQGYTGVETDFIVEGFASYQSEAGANADGISETNIYELQSKENFFYNGVDSRNSEGTVLKESDFVDVSAYADYMATTADSNYKTYERDLAGNIIYGSFLQLKNTINVTADNATVNLNNSIYTVAATNGQLEKIAATGRITLQGHSQSTGWGEEGSTIGVDGKRLEAFRATTAIAGKSVYYRAFVDGYGWLAWAKDGEVAGTIGLSKKIVKVQIMLVDEGAAFPSGDAYPFSNLATGVTYAGHQQTYGDLAAVSSGTVLGVTGQAKRLEGLTISSSIRGLTFNTTAHVQTYGDMKSVGNGQYIGTKGQSKRIEGFTINLSGIMSDSYTVYYKAHVQTYGWSSWTSEGNYVGTRGESKRVEAVQIVLECTETGVQY